MRYFTWKQIRAYLEILWDVYPSEESWAELRLVFLQCVAEEYDQSRRFGKRDYRMTYSNSREKHYFGERKPSLSYYDDEA